MDTPANLKYTKNHEWIKVEGTTGIVGITDFAQHELGDIVYVEIEKVGDDLSKEQAFGTIEAVKTVADVFMPVSGKVLEKNPDLEGTPEIANKSPYDKGWLIKIEIKNPSDLNDLMNSDQYKTMTEG